VPEGCSTSVAACFFSARKSWSHPVWHLFVMGGSACHDFAVLYYAAP
jgi:hemolysin III